MADRISKTICETVRIDSGSDELHSSIQSGRQSGATSPTRRSRNPSAGYRGNCKSPKTGIGSEGEVLDETESVCPVCLETIPAARVRRGETVFLEKRCQRHGDFQAVIWRGNPRLEDWKRPKIPSAPRQVLRPRERGCPHDCGPCPEHGQHTCTALIEVTGRCNLRCPVCFAAAGENPPADPSADQIRGLFGRVREAGGDCNVQLSGGEPTVRDDLPALIAAGKAAGVRFLQLNTNGLRLGTEDGYADLLKNAGLDSVFLQFDGVSDDVYQNLRGRPLLAEKARAIDACGAAGIGVVLVPTLVPGINTGQIGAILDFALERSPAVRGVHFQPISYFGRHPADGPPADAERITLPEILTALAEQTGGKVGPDQFRPPGCEHSLCSFNGNFIRMADGGLLPVGQNKDACCGPLIVAADGARQTIQTTARRWSAPEPFAGGCDCESPAPSEPANDLEAFARRAAAHGFSISAMAFQDAWNVDLERVRGCCIHAVSPDGRLIPFCAYNITAADGRPLHRGCQ
jgi:uncharacterized radical SAM superfamily Fe-S cluster-containing enzyme